MLVVWQNALRVNGSGLWWIACTQMMLLSTDYFDDFPTLGCINIVFSFRKSFETLLNVLCWRVSDGEKSLPFRSTFEFLVVELICTSLIRNRTLRPGTSRREIRSVACSRGLQVLDHVRGRTWSPLP
eukprot:6488357-Amphidinium_carterae.1